MHLKIDHIGIAVSDISSAGKGMQTLGFNCTETGQLDSEPMQGYPGLNARWAFYGTRGERSSILLLQPLSPRGPIHEFLRTHNAGAQHLAFAVDNLDEAYAVLSRAGIKFARPTAFVDPDGNRSHFFSMPEIPNLLFEIIEWVSRTT